MFTERLSSDKLFQHSVSSLSAETARRADSVLEVILLRCGLLYLSRFALLLLLLLLFITPKRQHSKTQAIQEIHKHNT